MNRQIPSMNCPRDPHFRSEVFHIRLRRHHLTAHLAPRKPITLQAQSTFHRVLQGG